jgi:NADPH-dependent curcumin reductase
MSKQTRRWVLAQRPHGVVQSDDFRLETVPLGALQPGQVHVRAVAFGNAPAMREWMDEHSEGTAPPILVGEPLRGGGVAVVVHSAHSEFREGDMVTGLMDWCEEAIIDPHQVWPRDAKAWAGARRYRLLDAGSDPGLALGVLGGNGLAAYFGIMDVAQPKAGETVVVSAAAGSVGSIAGQIARICGARVIGIAGGKGKIRQLVEDLGFDAGIDRSAPDFALQLRNACPEGINVYFDNVQGEVLDTCLEHLAKGGRVAMCGGVSVLNEDGGRARYNLMRVVWKRARLQGFSIFEYSEQKRHEALEQLGQWIQQGRLRIIQEHRHGFDQLPRAFIDLLAGRSSGSQVVWMRGTDLK